MRIGLGTRPYGNSRKSAQELLERELHPDEIEQAVLSRDAEDRVNGERANHPRILASFVTTCRSIDSPRSPIRVGLPAEHAHAHPESHPLPSLGRDEPLRDASVRTRCGEPLLHLLLDRGSDLPG